MTNIMTQLYNHSDIYNKVLEIKKSTLTRMSSADTFISKETTKYNYSSGRKNLKERKEQKVLQQHAKISKFNRKQD